MKFKVAPLLIILALQGCSSDSPSTSDVEKAFAAEFSSCPNVEISDAEIVNGVKVSDQLRQEEVTVKFDIKPLSKEKLDELRQREGQRSQQEQEVQALQKQVNDLTAKATEIDNQLAKQYPQGNSISMSSEYVEHRNQSEYPKLVDEAKAALDKANAISSNRSLWKPIDYVKEWGGENCLRKIGQFDYKDAVINGASYAYHGTLTMIQTDNGWMAAK